MPRLKLTPAEKEHRKHERSAARKNAKLAADHPLFVDQLQAEGAFTTPQAEYWHWRKNKAGSYDGGWKYNHAFGDRATCGLAWIEVQAIERFAQAFIDPAHFADLVAYVRHTYPMPDYGRMVWAELLTRGTPRVYRWELRFDPARINPNNSDGRYMVPAAGWLAEGAPPPLTREQFDAAFPKEPPPPAPLDDGGLYERLTQALRYNP